MAEYPLPDNVKEVLSSLDVKDQGAFAARARLSGLLIGSELAAARPYWLGQQVAIIGADDLSQAYATALAAQGVSATIADSTAMTLAGLRAAYVRLKEPVS